MNRSFLSITLLSLGLLVACKSKEEAARNATAQSERALAAAAPSDEIYAASAALRIVDAKSRSVTAKIDLHKAVRTIEFSADGRVAFVAASDGVRSIDTEKHEVLNKLSDHPARDLELDEDSNQLHVLEHQVIVEQNGTREIKPFSLISLDVRTGAVTHSEEIGQRILWARPATSPKLRGAFLTEAGELFLGAPGGPLKEAKLIDATAAGKATFRIREFPTIYAGKLYLPAEAESSRVLELDLESGALKIHDLGGAIHLRGLAVIDSGKTLLVNGVDRLLRLDLASGKVIDKLELGLHATGLALSSDGRFAYLAQTVDGSGGAIVMVSLERFAVVGKIHLDDISPWALAVRPRAAFAKND